MQRLPACPLLDGALDFFCLIYFPIENRSHSAHNLHYLIPGSSGHSKHPVALSFPISTLLFTADPAALKLGYRKIRSQTLIKCTHKCSETAQNTNRCSLQNVLFPTPFNVHLKHSLLATWDPLKARISCPHLFAGLSPLSPGLHLKWSKINSFHVGVFAVGQKAVHSQKPPAHFPPHCPHSKTQSVSLNRKTAKGCLALLQDHGEQAVCT